MKWLLATAIDIYVRNFSKLIVRKIAFLLLISTTTFTVNASASDRNITGQVKDHNGVSLAGVTISLKGTNISTITDSAGIFSIAIPDTRPNPVLIISSAGFISREIVVGSQSALNIQLETDFLKMSEVVVVGYG